MKTIYSSPSLVILDLQSSSLLATSYGEVHNSYDSNQPTYTRERRFYGLENEDDSKEKN